MQVCLEVSFSKNTAILLCTVLRSVKNMEEVTSSGFVALKYDIQDIEFLPLFILKCRRIWGINKTPIL